MWRLETTALASDVIEAVVLVGEVRMTFSQVISAPCIYVAPPLGDRIDVETLGGSTEKQRRRTERRR